MEVLFYSLYTQKKDLQRYISMTFSLKVKQSNGMIEYIFYTYQVPILSSNLRTKCLYLVSDIWNTGYRILLILTTRKRKVLIFLSFEVLNIVNQICKPTISNNFTYSVLLKNFFLNANLPIFFSVECAWFAYDILWNCFWI